MTLEEFLYSKFGSVPKSFPLPQGKIIRFAGAGKLHSKSCWVKFLGEIAICGDWRENSTFVWKSDSHLNQLDKMNKFQRDKYFEHMRQASIKALEESNTRKLEYIKEVWASLPSVSKIDEYFPKKWLNIFPDFRQHGDATALPMYNSNRQVVGYQLYQNGKKWFGENSSPKAAFYPILNNLKLSDCDVVFLCEGYATAYSLNNIVKAYSDSLLFSVFCCFSANNLKYIANIIRNWYPNKTIVGCADNDRTGTASMREANVPYFTFDSDVDGWDANDAWMNSPAGAIAEFANKYKYLLVP